MGDARGFRALLAIIANERLEAIETIGSFGREPLLT